MTNIDYSKYGALPENKKIDYSKYGATPDDVQIERSMPKSALSQAGDFAEKYINRPFEQGVVNPALGFIQSTVNTPIEAINALKNFIIRKNLTETLDRLPGQKKTTPEQFIPNIPTFDVAPHTLSSQAGEAASMVVNPFAGLQLAKAGKLGQIPQSALEGLSRTGSEIKGAITSPIENRLQNFYEQISPEKHAKELADILGHGSKSVRENTISLGKDIRKTHDDLEEQALAFLSHVTDKVGDEKIYKTPNPIISTAIDDSKNLIDKASNLNVGSLLDTFEKNKTFKNAQNLQSEIGHLIREAEDKPYKTPRDRADLINLHNVRDELLNQMHTHLKNHDMKSNDYLEKSYRNFRDFYRETVAPFLDNPILRHVVRNREEFVPNLESAFKNPTNYINKDGSVVMGDKYKVIAHLPAESKDKIIYNAIDGHTNDAQSMLNNLKHSQKEYGEYFDPKIYKHINDLEYKMRNKNNLKKALSLSGLATGAGVTGAIINHLL